MDMKEKAESILSHCRYLDSCLIQNGLTVACDSDIYHIAQAYLSTQARLDEAREIINHLIDAGDGLINTAQAREWLEGEK